MLKTHMDTLENTLIQQSKIPANSGHGVHKGTPREGFIRKFLEAHLPENVAVGTGEIIDAKSRPGENRNQFDIILYKKNYPKLDFGSGIYGFLVESVIATIEIKSTLKEDDLKKAMIAARCSKELVPNFTTAFHAGYIPPKILNYVVAYDGPTKMGTIYSWIQKVQTDLGIELLDLSQNETERFQTPSQSIDGIFILKKGFVYFDNIPVGLATAEMRRENSQIKWVYADTDSGTLLLFFLILQMATANIEGKWLNPIPYLSQFQLSNVRYGP